MLRIVMSAESAKEVLKPMRLVRDSRAAGRAYLEAPASAEDPENPKAACAVFEFEVKSEKEYFMWVRLWWPYGQRDGVTMTVDDGDRASAWHWGHRQWLWVRLNPASSNLSKGKHTLRVAIREKGVRLDEILLTTDKRYIPQGVEK